MAKRAELPSEAQRAVLQKLLEDPQHRLKRLRGGFWTTPSTPMTGPVLSPGRFDNGGPTPAWYTTMHTVRAMESRGWIRRANANVEDWKDERELTDVGRAVAPPC
jgi:hypothetical protein